MTYNNKCDPELDELFARTHHILSNSCNNCNSSDFGLNFNRLNAANAVTATPDGTVTTVTAETMPHQPSLLEPEADLETRFNQTIARITGSCSAPGYREWLEANQPGNWHLLQMAEREIKAALSGRRHSLPLAESVQSYEAVYRNAYQDYQTFRKAPVVNPTSAPKCRWCGSIDFWQGNGRLICRRCHPPAPGAERRNSNEGDK